MVSIGQEEETFNPLEIGIDLFSYESPACLQFEQRTRSYGTPKPQDEIAGPDNCGMWPTCDPDSKFCFGYNEVFGVNEQGTLRQWICFRDHERRAVKGSYMGFADFLQVRYGQQKIDDTTLERSYDVKEEYAREIGNPYSRRFDEYNKVFNNEIEHLSNKYILRIGNKGYVLDDVWEKWSQNYKKTNEAWHDKGDEALPLGRVNGARFKAMIRKELEGNKFDTIIEGLIQSYSDITSSTAIGVAVKGFQPSKNSTLDLRGIKSLREDGDNLKDFLQISNLEAMLREFLVLILLFPFYFISLMYNRDIVQIKWGRWE
ncbi:hypothetical protein Tco_0636899 [Tanacetum coccineum]